MKLLDKDWLAEYPRFLAVNLMRLADKWPDMFITGGSVRDWLRGERPVDLDLTVPADGLAAATEFASAAGGAFVLLDAEEGVARVVTKGLIVDFSSFRESSCDIDEDLSRRDFSINAMAVKVDPRSGTLLAPYQLIDPLGGAADLARGLVRAPTAKVFDNDPLRMLRAFRFAATLGLTLDEQTGDWIRERYTLIAKPARERISHELELTMASPRGAAAISAMSDFGLLLEIFPELAHGSGISQPASHHLDVLAHNLAALTAMENLLSYPAAFFPANPGEFSGYLERPGRPELLKWAALFHDLGKPATMDVRADGRATFYNHDRIGAKIFTGLAHRLRWSKERSGIVASLIELHMYPFHLNNALHWTGITPRACLRLVKAAGDELPGLFLLAMADSLAAQGPQKPPAMEESLALLYHKVTTVIHESVQPVLRGPRLINGEDLKALGLPPGPIFREVLDGLEQARVEGVVGDRETALTWVRTFMAAKQL